MASIVSRIFRRFQTRDPARDAATDAARLLKVRVALQEAIDSATNERNGLRRRVDEYYTQAAFLLDNVPEYAERADDEEQAIADAERQAAAAKRRVETIEAQLARLRQALSMLDEQVSSRAA